MLPILAGIVGCRALIHPPENAGTLTHGVAVGELSERGAVFWARCSGPTALGLRLSARFAGNHQRTYAERAIAERDFTARIAIGALEPDTTYFYEAWCGGEPGMVARGSFATPPAAARAAPLRFAWGGDLGGQNVCRDTRHGYLVFDTIRSVAPSFFVALGDYIYADDECKPVGRYGNHQIAGPPAPATKRPMFWEHWKYNRADPAFQRLLAVTPIYPVWDDHEIANDAASSSPELEPALQAFLDYQPLLPSSEAPTRLYRSARWGKHLELFFLDLRQYRDSNSAPDTAGTPKTMLGRRQRDWLVDRLKRSNATWKIIVSSVPLSIPTGHPSSGHDGWTGYGAGDGFEQEREIVLRAMSRTTPRNYVWITTDVHFGAAFRYRPFDDDPDFVFHEVISGPLNAGVFPQEPYDAKIGTERLLKYGPWSAESIASFEEALEWFNFGIIEIDDNATLTARLVNARGRTVYDLQLAPSLIWQESWPKS